MARRDTAATGHAQYRIIFVTLKTVKLMSFIVILWQDFAHDRFSQATIFFYNIMTHHLLTRLDRKEAQSRGHGNNTANVHIRLCL